MSRTIRQTPMTPAPPPQQAQAPNPIQTMLSQLDFQEPPDVQIIESNCRLADYKNETNNIFTTVLKEPLEIKKGSQIRVASSFIDMRGMDQEIIQFINDGDQQDNGHTLVTQLYTCNDGTNGKTTSYDYIAHNNVRTVWDLTNPGSLNVGGVHPTSTNGSGSGLTLNVTLFTAISVQILLKNNITITAVGQNYKTGDQITFTGMNTPASGFVVCNDLGQVKDIILTDNGAFVNPAPAVTASISGSSGGSGATLSVGNFLNKGSQLQKWEVGTNGTGYKVGDQITIENGQADKPILTLLAVTPDGAIPNKVFFDQGYNYQRAPVFRYAQTFEVSDNFCYGKNFKNRSYIASNGNNVSIYSNPPALDYDVRLSCAEVLQNKEDEFVSGIFHRQGESKQFNIYKLKQQFYTHPFKLEQLGGFTYLQVPNTIKTYTDSNGVVLQIKENTISNYAPGMAVSLEFSKEGGVLWDPTSFTNINNLCKNWAGIYTIGEVTLSNSNLTIDATTYTDGYIQLRFGALAEFDGTLERSGKLTDYALLGNGITGYPANSSQTLPFVNVARSDSLPMTGEGGFVNVQINGAGNGWSTYSPNNPGAGYKVGDQLTIKNSDGSNSNINILVLLVDNAGGIRACAQDGENITPTIIQANNIEFRLSQVPYYITGIGNIQNRPGNGSYNLNYNAVGCIQNFNRDAGCSYVNYEIYPPVFSDLGIDQSDGYPLDNQYQSAVVYSGLYKPAGLNPGDNNFQNLNSKFSLHSKNAYLSVNDNERNIVVLTVPADGTQSIWADFNNPSGQMSFKIQKTFYTGTGLTLNNLPQTYAKLNYTNSNDDPIEEHVYIRYWEDDGTNYVCHLKSRNIQEQACGVTLSNIANYDLKATVRINADPNIYNVKAGTNVAINFYRSDFRLNEVITLQWGFAGTGDTLPGSIGVGSTQNYYGNNDPNNTQLKKSSDWESIINRSALDPKTYNSYDQGGFYFLTHANQMLTNLDNTNLDNESAINSAGFAQGFNEFAVANLIPASFDSPVYIQNQTEIIKSPITNIQSVWDYEKFLTERTFQIPQDFSTPSAIGAWWTKESHKLKGALNPLTGGEYLTSDQTGLIQNEFILPVYGSNNQINGAGQYIPNYTLYPDSGGLEPGHCISKLGVDENASYLSTEMMINLPVNAEGQAFSYYNIFFRTFFTIIRNYDPLKNSGNNPDRSPLFTINTEARNIGNVNDSNGSPAVTTNKTLDGTTLIDIQSTSSGAPSAKELYKLYELGSPNPSAADDKAYFGSTSTEYPIRYIVNDDNNTYAKAKISNYVGANNLTLAYQQDISAFTFQFFFQPYTTPFVDGSGGDISTRVFFGNRRPGVFNHDAFGGNNVFNWTKPQFPRNTFTFEEILTNVTTPQFTNGVNPQTSVDPIGLRFLQKLGYTTQDLGIIYDSNDRQYKLTSQYGNLGVSETIYQTTIENDAGGQSNFTSYTSRFLSTNFSELDSSMSILSSIPPPENSAGINSHVQRITPTNGKSNQIINRWGDYIFYPYSLNSQTNSFQTQASQVRYDNATDTYGSVGGLLLTNASRGMGAPNTQGSTTLVNQSTVPVTLNPDANIYLSFTVTTNSNFITASQLPSKLNHGHMIVLSNLIQSPNYRLNNQGRLPGISIVNKTFLQGDYILSMGMLTFYAKEDRTLTEITTEIVNNDYSIPTSLGDKTTVIYEITNLNPKPLLPPAPIWAQQQAAYSIINTMNQAMAKQPQVNKLVKTMSDLKDLGLAALRDPSGDNSNIINQLSNYITQFDIPNMNSRERQEFFATPEGNEFLSQAQNLLSMEQNVNIIDQYAQTGEDMGPIQDIIAEVYGRLGMAHGALPDVGGMPEAFMIDELTGELLDVTDDPSLPQGPESDFPMGAGDVGAFSERFPESGMGQPQDIDLSSIRGQPGPPPPQTVAGDKPQSESGIGTSIATSE